MLPDERGTKLESKGELTEGKMRWDQKTGDREDELRSCSSSSSSSCLISLSFPFSESFVSCSGTRSSAHEGDAENSSAYIASNTGANVTHRF